jgi:hypothetical protein
MHTKRDAISAGVLLAAAGVIVAVLLFLRPSPGAHLGETPPDINLHGVAATPISTSGKVTHEAALATIERQYGSMFRSAQLDAYLVNASDPATTIQSADVWLIVARGLSIDAYGPAVPDGTPVKAGQYTAAYIYLDAVSGEWITTRYFTDP